jgi:heat shock protein HtpX
MILFAILAIAMVILSYVFVIGLAASCIYLPYLLAFQGSETPAAQAVVLLLFGVVIAGGMLWSLAPRPDRFKAPGPLLERTAHPRLFAELNGIAQSLNEPMPAEVYLIGDVNAWVADRGGMMGFGSRRVMGLGLPLLSILTVAQFRAVLAHEFAHYYGGDTRLGPWVYKTKMALVRTAQNVGALGRIARQWILYLMYLIVTKILQGYFIVFFRAMNLVSRRQEYRADELAALVTGPADLAEGLRLIHKASLAWAPYWHSEVAPLLGGGNIPQIGQGFLQFVQAKGVAQVVERELQKEIAEGKGDPYDTHPPLRDRIAALEKYPAVERQLEITPALQLLNDPLEMERVFVKTMNPGVRELRAVSWDEVGVKVKIPGWREFVCEYSALLEGTVGSLPEEVKRLREIGSRMRDPKGMLLDQKQKLEQASHLLGTSVALALVDHGWTLHAQPGVFHFCRAESKINPFEAVDEIVEAKVSREQWLERCQEMQIADLPLKPTRTPASA